MGAMSRIMLFVLLSWGAATAQTPVGWKLLWADEFSGPANSPPDSTKWGYDIGNGSPDNPGWGNNEKETYTNSTANAFQDGKGHLIIRALNDNGNYTSARLKTQGAFTFTYGKVEARIKLPYAQGIWPAFWMLGADISTVSWPASGEIDVTENFGVQNNDASVNHGTIHGPGYAGAGVSATYTLPANRQISADFHVFSIDWEPGSIEFLVDGNSYLKTTPASLPSGGQWVFDNNPMFLLLNVAVGGSPAPVGDPGATTQFPQDMLIDYVRVYQHVPLDSATPNIAPGGVVDAASSSSAMAPGGLASLYGVNLSDATYDTTALFNSAVGAFPASTPSGVSVVVDSVKAPLIYVSPSQVNFQVPWEAHAGPAPVNVQVFRGSASSYMEPVSLSSTAPSAFLNYSAGVALVTGCGGCAPAPGATCVLWGNGFGPKNAPQQDGVPASGTPSSLSGLEVPGSPAACQLTIAGQPATILYCGAAPGEVIDQLNFTYPSTVPGSGPSAEATLTINAATGNLTIPISR